MSAQYRRRSRGQSRYATAVDTPALEFLETRPLLSTVTWDGGGDGSSWSDPLNWSADVLPAGGDDVVIASPAPLTVNYTSGATGVRSLLCNSNLSLMAGVLSVDAPSAVAGAFSMSGGSLGGAGDLTLVGGFTWSAGAMLPGGRTSVYPGAPATIGGNAALGRTLVLDRAATLIGGPLWIAGGLVVNLQNLTLEGTSSLLDGRVGGAAAIQNRGIITKGGGGDAIIGVPMVSPGTLDIQAGSLTLWSPAGSDDFVIPGGQVMGAGDLIVYGAGLTANTAQFSGPGNVSIYRNASFTISGSSSLTTTIVNDGVTRWYDTTTLPAGAVFLNLFQLNMIAATTIAGSGGVITNRGELRWSALAQGVPPTAGLRIVHLVNTGTITVSDGFLYVDGELDNSGTIDGGLSFYRGVVNWDSGSASGLRLLPGATLNITGTVTVGSAGLRNTGTINWLGGDLRLDSILFNPGVLNAGPASGNVVDVGGGSGAGITAGTLNITPGASPKDIGGMLDGILHINIDAGQVRLLLSFVNSGSLTLRSGAELMALAGFTQSARGILNTQIGGPDTAHYGHMVVVGSAALDGTLAATYTYTPSPDDIFTLLSFGSRQGAFATFTPPAPGASLDYLSSSVRMLHPTPVTFHVLLSSNGPVGNGVRVDGMIRVDWSYPGGVGYYGGAFRLRMNGLSVGDIDLPVETTAEHIGINGATTVWSSGRRPRTSDGATGDTGGGFRFPPIGSGPTDVRYVAEQQAGIAYLTSRNGQGENRIEHIQNPPNGPIPNPFFVTDPTFDLFKFSVRAPMNGSGSVSIGAEINVAEILLNPVTNFFTDVAVSATVASFTYGP
jgi:hypothetical protein